MKIFILIFLLSSYISFGKLQINEVCPDNEELLAASDGKYYDWIEIYNNSDESIQLSNYHISDDIDDLQKWNFKPQLLDAKSYLILFASDKDSLITEQQHTNFKLSSSGETLYLSDSNGLIDTMEFGTVNEDYTYGRLEESSEIKTNLAKPTPNESNSISGTIIANKESGYYNENFDLTLTAAEGQNIYYTTNGDDPTLESKLYDGKIEIKDEYEKDEYLDIPTTPAVDKGCLLSWKKVRTEIPRCKVICFRTIDDSGYLGSVHSKSYFLDDLHQLPVLSVISDNQNLFNYETGIYVPGVHWKENDPCNSGNYKMRGEEWEKPSAFSYFKDGKLLTQQNAGIRIHGSGSRVLSQKSFRLYARKEYGINKFPNVFLEESSVKDFDNFIVRGTMNDFSNTMIKDAVSMEAIKNLNLDQTYIQPVVVYLNGNYWGIHEIRTRFDEDYLATKFDLDKDSIDLVSPVIKGNPWEEKAKKMKIVYDFILENDLSIDENYEYIRGVYNIPQIIDYYIAETYFLNKDWPGNNLLFWYHYEEQNYRPIFFDLDAGWVFEDFDMLEFITQMEHNNYPNPRQANVIFVKLIENSEFRKQFIERALYLIDNEFTYEKIKDILDKYVGQYDFELDRSMDRWQFPESREKWKRTLFLEFYEFARHRSCLYKEHLVNYFNLDSKLLCNPTSEDSAENKRAIFPNPATNIISVSNLSSDNISIVDIRGTELMKIKSKYRETMRIDISSLAQGVYFVKSENYVYKFVKIKK